jgi:hypothetical protein
MQKCRFCRKRSEREARKHIQRRKKRKRGKAVHSEAPEADGAPPQAERDELLASDLLAPLQVRRLCSEVGMLSMHTSQMPE